MKHEDKQLSLEEWLNENHITYTLRKDILVIPKFGRFLIQKNYDHIFKIDNLTGDVLFNYAENIAFLEGDDIGYVVFPFGDRWYYVDIKEQPSKLQFHQLRWI